MSFQHNRPLFIASRHHTIKWKGKTYGAQEVFPWVELDVPLEIMNTYYTTGRLIHSETLEAQDVSVGDRLNELTSTQLAKVVRLTNHFVKKKAAGSKTEYARLKIKTSTNAEKQKTLIRQWISRSHKWGLEEFQRIRDAELDTVPTEE